MHKEVWTWKYNVSMTCCIASVLMCACLFADLWLLKDEESLKCFTRTQYDFTCFFETSDNRTYDLFYDVNGYVQRGYMEESVYEPERMSGCWTFFFRVFTGPKSVNCLYRRPTVEPGFTSAHFLPWMLSCMWKWTLRWWSAAPTLTCTIGPSVSKISVRNVLFESKIFNKKSEQSNRTWARTRVVLMLHFLHFLYSRC